MNRSKTIKTVFIKLVAYKDGLAFAFGVAAQRGFQRLPDFRQDQQNIEVLHRSESVSFFSLLRELSQTSVSERFWFLLLPWNHRYVESFYRNFANWESKAFNQRTFKRNNRYFLRIKCHFYEKKHVYDATEHAKKCIARGSCVQYSSYGHYCWSKLQPFQRSVQPRPFLLAMLLLQRAPNRPKPNGRSAFFPRWGGDRSTSDPSFCPGTNFSKSLALQ